MEILAVAMKTVAMAIAIAIQSIVVADDGLVRYLLLPHCFYTPSKNLDDFIVQNIRIISTEFILGTK
jgi:hypothetical protein